MIKILMFATAAAVCLILCDVLIVNNGIKKYARFAVGIAVATALSAEIVSLFTADYTTYSEFTIDAGYIQLVDEQFEVVIGSAIEASLAENGFEAEIECEIVDNEISAITATVNFEIGKEEAEEIGFAIVEIAGVELYKIKIKIAD